VIELGFSRLFHTTLAATGSSTLSYIGAYFHGECPFLLPYKQDLYTVGGLRTYVKSNRWDAFWEQYKELQIAV
jgi:hypothetical protein